MLGGSIIVRGNAGGHVGRYMSGGVIKIEGQIGSITKSYQGRIYHKGTLQ
jgi:formylmethanofuran dehydrogenase subunit C